MPKADPITIGDETFKSRRELARAKGVSVQTVTNAINNNTLELLGIKMRSVEYEGVVYDSCADAGRATGKSRQAVWAAINRQLGGFVPKSKSKSNG